MQQILHVFIRPDLVDELLELVEAQGSWGATILRGRGASNHPEQRFLNVAIEHQVSLVILVVDKAKIQGMIQALQEHFDFNQAGTGLLCSLPAYSVRGLDNRKS